MKFFLHVSVLFCFSLSLFAEDKKGIVIEEARFRAFHLAVPNMKTMGSVDTNTANILAATIRRDLEMSGVFKLLDPKSFLVDAQKEGMSPDDVKRAAWTQVGAEGLAKVSLSFDKQQLQATLLNMFIGVSGKTLSRRYIGNTSQAEYLGHQIANDIFEFFTGDKGVFLTKIAASKKIGNGKQITLLNLSGAQEKQLTQRSLNILPVFSSKGNQVYYTSYESGNPDIYVINTDGSGKRKISSYPGLNIVGSVSPDGTQIAATLSKDGDSEIYLLDANGNIVKRLTTSWGIDTSPVFSPDGKQIAFVSSRSGNPHVYVMNKDGSNQRRLTFKGKYCQTPRWSPNSEWIAFTARDEFNIFDIFLVEVKTGQIKRVTQSQGKNEDPSFSPNGRQLIFTSTRNGARDIILSNFDGTQQVSLTKGEYYFTPAWGPVTQ